MNITDSDYYRYRNVLTQNRELFLLKFPNVFRDFVRLDMLFVKAAEISKLRNANKENNAGFIPLVNVMRRQTVNAFESLACMQADQAWVIFRPAIEAALVMGKWMDNPSDCEVWKNRHQHVKEYKDKFWGKGVVSHSLPRAADLRAVLTRINDEYMHLNCDYVNRSTIIRPIDRDNLSISIGYIESDNPHEAHLYSFLHVAAISLDAVTEMIAKDVGQPEANAVGLKHFEEVYQSLVSTLAKSDIAAKRILKDFGLWKIDWGKS